MCLFVDFCGYTFTSAPMACSDEWHGKFLSRTSLSVRVSWQKHYLLGKLLQLLCKCGDFWTGMYCNYMWFWSYLIYIQYSLRFLLGWFLLRFYFNIQQDICSICHEKCNKYHQHSTRPALELNRPSPQHLGDPLLLMTAHILQLLQLRSSCI